MITADHVLPKGSNIIECCHPPRLLFLSCSDVKFTYLHGRVAGGAALACGSCLTLLAEGRTYLITAPGPQIGHRLGC